MMATRRLAVDVGTSRLIGEDQAGTAQACSRASSPAVR
jgi:hypothetical protein